MKISILKIFTIISFLILGFSCSDDHDFRFERPSDDDGELPVDFSMIFPDEFENESGTRSIENPRDRFTPGDVIHIQGTFVMNYDGVDREPVTRYGALSYNGKKWVPVEGSLLKWPNMSTSGTFKAYFIYNSNGLLKPEDTQTSVYSLSDITPQTDPLQAISASNIPYGNAVKLEFTHICSYLSITSLEPIVTTSYWFMLPETATTPTVLNNAFYLSLNENNELSFNFTSQGDPNFDNLVYIGYTVPQTEDAIVNQANFFLEPGLYENFLLSYPTVAPNYLEYLEYNYSNVPQNEETTPVVPNFQANTTYTLDISKAPGVSITLPPDAEGWDESDQVFKVDVEAFLRAVNAGSEYFENGVKILEQTPIGTRLLYNVDFQFYEYNIFPNGDGTYFQPNINEGQVFDGGYHYIWNLGSPFIRYNLGTIQNLGLKTVNANITTVENANENLDLSRQGGLCNWNRSTGVIKNIRVTENVTINAQVLNDDDQETHNIGCIIGSNTGLVEEVYLSGDFNLNVTNYYDSTAEVNYPVIATVLIGGIVGQEAGSGNISQIGPLDGANVSFTITNSCTGNSGAYYVGGIVGQNNGFIDNVVIPSVNINGTASSGVASYMGSIAGDLQTTDNAGLSYCNVVGTIQAGKTKPFGSVNSVSYTGGISGGLQNVPVQNCNVTVNIYGPTETTEKVTYATGGAFGRIRTLTDISYVIALGGVLQGPAQYMGNFAGIAPEGTQSSYNRADIIVANRVANYIGAYINAGTN